MQTKRQSTPSIRPNHVFALAVGNVTVLILVRTSLRLTKERASA